jgi:anthranilate synthase component 1
VNGFFGYAAYDAVPYFEKISFKAPVKEDYKIPDVRYSFYKTIIAINHFQNVLYIIENQFDGEFSESEKIETLLGSRNFASYPFQAVGEEHSNITDEEYRKWCPRKTLLPG